MKLYIESLKMHLKSTLEYKTSFIIGFFSQFLVYFTYYFIIIALFNNKGVIYKYAFVCGEVFLVIFLIKIIIKGISILGVRIIKFGCYMKKCWNKKKC